VTKENDTDFGKMTAAPLECGTEDAPTVTKKYLDALRKAVGGHIDPDTAEVM